MEPFLSDALVTRFGGTPSGLPRAVRLGAIACPCARPILHRFNSRPATFPSGSA
jgi:hypothetical protein